MHSDNISIYVLANKEYIRFSVKRNKMNKFNFSFKH